MNPTSKVTPGPWRYIAHGGHSFFIHSASKPTAHSIATVSYTDGAHSFHEADARMIAAAPEMYEALKEMLFSFKNPHRDEWLNEAAFERAVNACAAAEIALAKADGE